MTTTMAATFEGWLTGTTGRGEARWARGPALLTYRGGGDFGWAVAPGVTVRDGFVEAEFLPAGGRADQAGGVVWRFRDAGHYYVARANALEDNVVAYRVVGGRRRDIKPVGASAPNAYGVSVPVARQAWHTLRVDFAADEAVVSFDGRRLFAVRDGSLTEAGAVGVWSKADSVTEFRALRHGGR